MLTCSIFPLPCCHQTRGTLPKGGWQSEWIVVELRSAEEVVPECTEMRPSRFSAHSRSEQLSWSNRGALSCQESQVGKVGGNLQKSGSLWKAEPDFFTCVRGLQTLPRPCFESRTKIIQRHVQKKRALFKGSNSELSEMRNYGSIMHFMM